MAFFGPEHDWAFKPREVPSDEEVIRLMREQLAAKMQSAALAQGMVERAAELDAVEEVFNAPERTGGRL